MSAVILILITFSQLMLTSSDRNLTEIENEFLLVKNELNTFMAKYGNITAMSARGKFVRKVGDTIIIKNKLHELQNNVTKLAEAISNKNQNVDDVKNRISSTEKEIEILSKLYDDIERELTQTQTKFEIILSNLLATSNKYQNVDDIQNRIFTLEKQIENLNKLYDDKDREIKSDLLVNYDYKNHELEIAKLQDEEFLEAIKHRYYQLAVVKFMIMKNESSALNLVQSVYEEIGDLPPMLEFADKVDDLERKLLIYRTIVNSNTFRHCLGCNLFLTYRNMKYTPYSYQYAGSEIGQIIEETYSTLADLGRSFIEVHFDIKTPPESEKLLAQRYCSSGRQLAPLDKPAIHDYSGYCYPIDAINSIYQ